MQIQMQQDVIFHTYSSQLSLYQSHYDQIDYTEIYASYPNVQSIQKIDVALLRQNY